MDVVRKRVLVSGYVQGVSFRYYCLREAQRAGVAGWATNLPDGRVEAVFEGSPDAVDRLVEWCRHGPSAAEVSGIEVVEEPPEGLRRFEIS